VEVQRGMAAQNADVPQDVRIEFRIGIHVGDIIFDDNDIFGGQQKAATPPPLPCCLSPVCGRVRR
jgi:class 3 adenylate cyclase